MEAFIAWITKNLLALWPIARIYSWERGIRLRGGIIAGELLNPGLHWRWWFIDEVYRSSYVDQTLDLLTPAIVLTDDRTVVASGNVVYRIVDVRKQWMSVRDLDANMRNLALGILASVLTTYSWPDLRGKRVEVESAIAERMARQTAAWGIDVRSVFITDLAPTKVIRLVDGRD